ncbi:hypothetical protein [Mycobacterium marinum]|uniref:hypothetical protein n=1 Tax=Mycobacterium marinum TaxID=1781 RepID=UPI003563AD69
MVSTIGRPVGEYAELMLDPGGWPGFAPTELRGYSAETGFRILGVRGTLAGVHGLSQDLFETWAGPAASAATARLAEIIAHCETLVAFLQSIQRWFLTVAADVRTMQLLIAASVASAEAQIHALEAAGPENEAAIQAIVVQRHAIHLQMVESLAARINASAAGVLAAAPV